MRRLLGLFITVLVISCSGDSNSFKLEGTAAGFEDGTQVFLYSIGSNNQPDIVDTLTVNNGKFEGTFAKSDEVTVNYMNIGKINANIFYFPENEDLTATIYKDSVPASFVTGSKQNDAYAAFSRQLREFGAKRRETVEIYRTAQREQDDLLAREMQQENAALIADEREYKKEFIAENNNSLFSVMLLSEMLSRQEVTGPEAKQYIENLTPKVAATKVAKDVENLISTLSAADVGAIAPEFSAPTPEGDLLSLSDTMGEYTIVDFWASWCKPCRLENPNVVRVYNKYHDKGLNIISVSLDRNGQRDRWLKAIEDDQMDWYHVSNLKFWQDPIARQYGVKAIPATFLLDKNGQIIAKNLRGQALENKIASLLGGS